MRNIPNGRRRARRLGVLGRLRWLRYPDHAHRGCAPGTNAGAAGWIPRGNTYADVVMRNSDCAIPYFDATNLAIRETRHRRIDPYSPKSVGADRPQRGAPFIINSCSSEYRAGSSSLRKNPRFFDATPIPTSLPVVAQSFLINSRPSTESRTTIAPSRKGISGRVLNSRLPNLSPPPPPEDRYRG